MRRRAEFDALLRSQLHAGTVVRLLFRLRRAHPELAFEIDQISCALKQAADVLAQFDDAAGSAVDPDPARSLAP